MRFLGTGEVNLIKSTENNTKSPLQVGSTRGYRENFRDLSKPRIVEQFLIQLNSFSRYEIARPGIEFTCSNRTRTAGLESRSKTAALSCDWGSATILKDYSRPLVCPVTPIFKQLRTFRNFQKPN